MASSQTQTADVKVKSNKPRRSAAEVANAVAQSTVRILLTVLAILVITFAVLTLIARLGLPLVASYKSEIEAGLGDYLGRPVTIQQLDLRWRRIGPELTATGLEVAESEGRRVGIDEALLDVDLLASVLRRTLVINELTFVGADLAVERAEDGVISLHGLSTTGGSRSGQLSEAPSQPPSQPPSEPSAQGRGLDAVAWLFNARRVGLLETQLRFIDYAGGQGSEAVVLERVDLRAENVDGDHRLRAVVDLPDELGEQLELAIDLKSVSGNSLARRASGQFHVSGAELNVPSILSRLESGLGGDAAAGIAAFRSSIDIAEGRLSVDLRGQLHDSKVVSAVARLDMSEINRQDGVRLADLATAQLQWSAQADDAWSLSGNDLELHRGDERLRVATLQVDQSASGLAVEASGNEGSVNFAASLATVVSSLQASTWVDAAVPEGRIAGWRAAVNLGEGPPQVDVVVSVPELSFKAALGAPGVSSIALSAVLEDRAGRIDVRSRVSDEATLGGDISVDWPTLYSSPLQFESVYAVLDVVSGIDGLTIQGPVQLGSGSLDVSTQLAVELQAERSPFVDLRGRFSLGDATEVAGFLPDKWLGKNTVAWFSNGLRNGSLSDGELQLRGHLADFPFEDEDGEFRVAMQARDVDLQWLDGWPMAEAMDGTVSFDGAGFKAVTERGRISSMDFSRGIVAIDNLAVPLLTIDASGADELPSMLAFATTGPLQRFLEPALNDVTAQGAANMDLQVRVPLTTLAKERNGPLAVQGQLYLSNTPMSFGRAQLDLESVTGAVGFDLDGVSIRSLKAQWLGRPISIVAGMSGPENNRRLRLRMDGALEGADVLAHYGIPLDRFVGGASRWLATLDIPFNAATQESEGFLLSATSDLIGSELRLPAPLYKSSTTVRPMTVSTRIRPGESVARWTVEQNRYADVVVDVIDGQMGSLALGLGATRASTSGSEGIRIDGSVDVLNLDGWIESLADLITDIESGAETAESSDGPILAVSGRLIAQQAVLRSMPLGEMQLTLNSDDSYLNTVIENRFLRGNARYPREHVRGDTKPMKVRLALVDERIVDALLGKAEAEVGETVATDTTGGLDPRELPPIEARISNLRWQDLDLSGLVLTTEPDIAGLNIVTLGFSHDNLTLIGEGYWRLSDPQGVSLAKTTEHETNLSVILQSSDFGRGLGGIGLDGLIGAGAGRARAVLGWAGPAWRPDIEQLDGNLWIDLERGSIPKVEPGAGRLIGLFAFQALPQRLGLDFSDVVNDGLAFSSLEGEAAIRGGVIDASLVRMEGPIGVVDVVGQTDLASQSFDQRITVLPRVSAALPIIGAISGGASAGIGVLIAGGLLKALGVDLDRIGLREYRLHGSWDDPVIEPWQGR